MKKFLLIAFVFLVKSAFAQTDTVGLNIPFKDGAVTYERVMPATGESKELLYSNAQLWFLNHYKSNKGIEVLDSALNRVVAKGMEPTTFKGPLGRSIDCNDKFSIQIDCKDGRYRCRITSITVQSSDLEDNESITMEELIATATDQKGYHLLNKSQALRALAAINNTIINAMASLNKEMIDKNDF